MLSQTTLQIDVFAQPRERILTIDLLIKWKIMDPYFLNTDINVLCVTADPFPEGIMAAFDKLNSLVRSNGRRRLFGISCGNGNDKILYKAAAEEKSAGEAEQLGCERITIKRGEYISVYIPDFMSRIPTIGEAFRTMCRDKRIDAHGYCVEMYVNNNNDVLCMVPLDPEKL